MPAPPKPVKKPEWRCDIRNRSGRTASIDLYGPVGGSFWSDDGFTAADVNKLLASLTGTTDLYVHINSPGGSVFEGLAIYNRLRTAAPAIHVVIDGVAASIASVIALAGKTITVADGAQIMIHRPWAGEVGTADDLRAMANRLDEMGGALADVYARRTGQPLADIVAWMAAETWMDGSQALARGFATHYDIATKLVACAGLDRMGYRHIPPALLAGMAPSPLPGASSPPSPRLRASQDRLAALSKGLPSGR